MINDKVLFEEEEVHDVPYGDALSLLQATKEYENTVPVTRYSFLHHTLQELLAAIHMSRLPADHQYEIFLQRFVQPRFATMIQIYAGMTLLRIPEIRSTLADKALVDFDSAKNDDANFMLRSPRIMQFLFETTKSLLHGHEDCFSDEHINFKAVLNDYDSFYKTIAEAEEFSKVSIA